MLEFSWLVCGFFYSVLYCYLFSSFICNEKFKINKSIIICSIIFAIFYLFIMKHNVGIVQPFLTHFLISILFLYNYKKSLSKTLIGALFIYILICFSELIYDLFFMYILKLDLISSLENIFIYVISNLVILIIAVLLSKIHHIKKIIYNIVKWYDNNEFITMTFFILIAMAIVTFLMYNNFIKWLPNSILWFTDIFCISVMIFVVGFFKERSNNNRIITEYDHLLNYVKTYEALIEEKSKNQHEYKNQLILIKSMISKRNKEAINYIDELFNSEKDDKDIELLKKLQYLPQGGLKGLIYYKVEEMINKNIDVYVDISSELKDKKISKVLQNNLQDISKIIGVYIDNAIEACLQASKKYIIIESYLEDGYIVFSFSNTYVGNINMSRLDKGGYTTKGDGKGYGLSLAKDTIERNNSLSQKREIRGIYYIQKLYIKK